MPRFARRGPNGMETRRMPAVLQMGKLRLPRVYAPGDHRGESLLAHGRVERLPMGAEAGAGIAGAAPQLLKASQNLAALRQILPAQRAIAKGFEVVGVHLL